VHIDAHQHFWRYTRAAYRWIPDGILAQDYLPADLKPLLEASGFDGTVAVQARSTWEETRWLLALADAHPWIVGVVGWADLCAADVTEQLAYFDAHPAFCGVRCGLEAAPAAPDVPRADFIEGITALTAADLAFDLLIRPSELPLARRLAEATPDQRFILNHIAKPPIKDRVVMPWATDIRALAAHPNVACKVSGMVTEANPDGWQVADFASYLDIVFEAFGPERLMIGSDWPVSLQAAPYETTMRIVENYIEHLSERDRAAVLGDTASEWYRLGVNA
jgi:L-fuconolactonase